MFVHQCLLDMKSANLLEKTCLVANGGWSEWSSSPCSATCGDGTKNETRSCTNPAPLHGGKNCEGDSVRVTPCHTGQCPSKFVNELHIFSQDYCSD